jgi:hypothetical protein
MGRARRAAADAVAAPGVGVVRAWLFETTELAFDFDSPVGLSLGLLQLGTVVVGLAGVWALSDGLIDAGARIGRRLLVAAIAVGLILGAWLVPFYLPSADAVGSTMARPLFWLNLAGLFLYTVDAVLWSIVAVRLMVGSQLHLRPGRAWAIGAFAGAAFILARLVSMLLVLGRMQDAWLNVPAQLLAAAPWILLVLAFLAGLGRGRLRHDAPPRRMRLFIRNPTD